MKKRITSENLTEFVNYSLNQLPVFDLFNEKISYRYGNRRVPTFRFEVKYNPDDSLYLKKIL